MLQTELTDTEMKMVTDVCRSLGLKKSRFYRDAILDKASKERRRDLEVVR